MGKDNEAADKIKTYLEAQNRPYSVNDIFMNLHKDVGKTAVQKALDQLVADGAVKEKTYGKQKVYVYDQSHFPSLDEKQLKEMDGRIVELTESLRETEKECTEVEAKLRGLSSSLTTEEAQEKIVELEEEVANLQKRLTNLEDNQVLVSKEEKEKICSESDNMNKTWRKRKRMATDILDAILEGYPKSKKQLFEEVGIETDEEPLQEVGIETDEEVGVSLPKT